MLFMRLGLQAAGLVFVIASIASWVAGYPPEIALARGTIAAVAVGVAAYVVELVVATTPSRPRAERVAPEEPPAAAAPRPLEGEVTTPQQSNEAA